MKSKLMTLFTRTPLHIGAGSSVGAIDQPIVRERHTRFPIIPGTSIKGVLADLWVEPGKPRSPDAVWLFGAEDAKAASAGALLIGEGKLLAFPVRSAKGCFAWITCPLTLSRLARDTGNAALPIPSLADHQAQSPAAMRINGTVILEEYVLESAEVPGDALVDALRPLSTDAVWTQLKDKLVVLSDELFAYFAEHACEVAQHIRIDDQTGTVAPGALFNQENVPSETLFYAVLNAQDQKSGDPSNRRPAEEALNTLEQRCREAGCIQIGADETTGLGWCSLNFA
ncbi:MAG: type III-B CRISPR module RAMP protein Cmr4 [Lentisphaerae bacterium]|nr:type III-B CRISPR module RAMP protein Cmr4 [Lentisphaerota bacterium]